MAFIPPPSEMAPSAAGPPTSGPPLMDSPAQPPAPALPTGEQQLPPPQAPASSEGDLDERELDQFMDLIYQSVYGGSTPTGELNAPIASMLRRGANNPVESLAQTSAQVTAKAMSDQAEANVSTDPAVALAANFQLVEELGNVAGMEGIYDYGEDELSAAAVQSGELLFKMTQNIGVFNQDEAARDVEEIVNSSAGSDMDSALGALETLKAGPPMPGGGSIMPGDSPMPGGGSMPAGGSPIMGAAKGGAQ